MPQHHSSPSSLPMISGPSTKYLDGLNQTSKNDTLLVSIESQNAIYHMVLEDLIQVFARYGAIQSVQMLNEGNTALIHYMNQNSALLAIERLDGKPLKGTSGTLRVQLLSSYLEDDSSDYSDDSHSKSKMVKKYTARYDVQIDPDDGFDVAKRIIGIKGINMKQIHNKTQSKLRLRGKGSGYLEGHNRKEAPELLHLCISCQDHINYTEARMMVEGLLLRIYDEYDSWRIENGSEALSLRPKCHETLIQFSMPKKFTKSELRDTESDRANNEIHQEELKHPDIHSCFELLKSEIRSSSPHLITTSNFDFSQFSSDNSLKVDIENLFSQEDYSIFNSINKYPSSSNLSISALPTHFEGLLKEEFQQHQFSGESFDFNVKNELIKKFPNQQATDSTLQNLTYHSSFLKQEHSHMGDPNYSSKESLTQLLDKFSNPRMGLNEILQSYLESGKLSIDSSDRSSRSCNESFLVG